MNSPTFKRVGTWAGYLIVPLLIASALSLLTLQRFEPVVIVFLLCLAVSLLLFTITNPEVVGRLFKEHSLKNWVTTIIIVISVIGIVALVNVFASRFTVRVDTTANKIYSLSDASLKTIEKLKDPVKISIFYSQRTTSQRDQAVDLINEYKVRTDKITFETFDIESLAGLGKAQELKITSDPSVVFEQGTRHENATTIDEQTFTRTIIKLGQQVTKRVLFTTGHGERSTTSSSTSSQVDGISQAKQALSDNNFQTDTINLLTNTGSDGKPIKLDPATDILIFAGTSSSLKAEEVQAAIKFLQQGGAALFLNDPRTFYDPSKTQAASTHSNINDILSQWNGLKFSDGWLLETDPSLAARSNPLVLLPDPKQSSSDIVNTLTSAIVLYLNSSIDKGTNDTGFTPLISSSSSSYLITDPQKIDQQKFEFDSQKDKRGPLVIAASLEADAKDTATTASATPTAGATPAATPTASAASTKKTRMLLFSGVDFISDNQQVGLMSSAGNYNLFLNSVNWLAQQTDAVVIQQKQADTTPFTISKSQDTFIYYSTVFGLPILLFFVGLVVWWRRR